MMRVPSLGKEIYSVLNKYLHTRKTFEFIYFLVIVEKSLFGETRKFHDDIHSLFLSLPLDRNNK